MGKKGSFWKILRFAEEKGKKTRLEGGTLIRSEEKWEAISLRVKPRAHVTGGGIFRDDEEGGNVVRHGKGNPFSGTCVNPYRKVGQRWRTVLVVEDKSCGRT